MDVDLVIGLLSRCDVAVSFLPFCYRSIFCKHHCLSLTCTVLSILLGVLYSMYYEYILKSKVIDTKT